MNLLRWLKKPEPTVSEFTKAEGRQLLDREAQRCLSISGEEFLRRWDLGDYRAVADTPGVRDVASLINFAR